MREILRVTLQCSGYAASLDRHLQPAEGEEKGKAVEEETKTKELYGKVTDTTKMRKRYKGGRWEVKVEKGGRKGGCRGGTT